MYKILYMSAMLSIFAGTIPGFGLNHLTEFEINGAYSNSIMAVKIQDDKPDQADPFDP